MKIEPNVPAFPIVNDGHIQYDGLTKREYFAAMAMQGLIASNDKINFDEAADFAVEHADELIARLNK